VLVVTENIDRYYVCDTNCDVSHTAYCSFFSAYQKGDFI